MQTRPVYRTSAASPSLLALVDRGRALRESAGWDPHAMAAPAELSAPRASALEEIAARYELVLEREDAPRSLAARLAATVAGLPALFVYGAIIAGAFVIVVAFALVASLLARWIVLLAPLTVLAAAAVVADRLASQQSPRRWLARSPLRIDGYLELLGREERVVRVRVIVRFAHRCAPDLAWFKDLLTGAGISTRGVEPVEQGALAVHSPDIHGERAILHPWLQRLCDEALVPLHEEWPIVAVVVEER